MRFAASEVLPSVRQWIDNYLQQHSEQARSVGSLNFPKLQLYFPEALLGSTKTVTVPEIVFPPVHLFGLLEFAKLQQMSFDGITFKDTYFVRAGRDTHESLHIHELVHVCQWARLGVDRFLLVYGACLAQYEYEHSALEQMAYDVQKAFEQGRALTNLMQTIEQLTDRVWQETAPLVGVGIAP